ncbi:MgtC/SapB family protein [Terrisporobacter vanillatitrophus]|uniref:MgtC/SapB family protein n=1 Tax=Terrisporobacter vanillatitrophus TaxID=3058402 RepID=UPI0033673B9C
MGDIILKNQEVIIKLLLAVLVGGFTGYEREKSNQFAGFRTHILVSIGSCITSIIALELFTKYSGTTTMDPARLPAQVLSGIGFLGAGAILKNSNGIRGLTTAAGIWTTACIGIAIGYGQYVLGISAWILVMGTLYVLKNIDKVISPKSQTVLKATITSLDAISNMVNKIKSSEIIIRNFQIITKSEAIWEINFLLEYDKRLMLSELVIELEGINNVVNIEYIK